MNVSFDCAVIGGDKRLVYIAELLTDKGFNVITYGVDTNNGEIAAADSLKDAVNPSSVIIAPIPLTRDQKSILSNIPKEDLTLEALKNTLTDRHSFFAGCIPESLTDYGRENNIYIYDFMKDEELTIYNTIATAEGAIAEAIKYQPTNLHGSGCLVLGFGRCAKILAAKLKGLSANVTVCARNKNALAEADAYGYEILNLNNIDKHINTFEYIFNTIPSVILPESTLSLIRKDSLLIDIAPGGFDYEYALSLGLDTHLALGLPGKYSPKSSAEALTDVILQKGRDNKWK